MNNVNEFNLNAQTDTTNSGPSKTEVVHMILEQFNGRYFEDSNGVGYAELEQNGKRMSYPINSVKLTNRIVYLSRKTLGIDVSPATVRNVLSGYAAAAEENKEEAHVRCAFDEDEGIIYINLCDDDGNYIAIDKDEWFITTSPGVAFRTPRTAQPLPLPSNNVDGDLNLLKKYTNLTDEQFRLYETWLVMAYFPYGAKPLLAPLGEHGTAKSTTSEVAKRVLDPSSPMRRKQPSESKAIQIACLHSLVPLYDNVSYLNGDMSDTLCLVSTGGGSSDRELYSDNDESVIEVMRPVIMNGITDFIKLPDLLDRSIILRLNLISASERKTEREFWADFNNDLPKILAGLYNALSHSLKEFDNNKLDESPRMADFAQLGKTLEAHLGYEPGSFMEIYGDVVKNNRLAGIDNSTLASLILDMFADDNASNFFGTSTDLITRLSVLTDDSKVKSEIPSSRKMRDQLKRIAPALREVGIEVDTECRDRKVSIIRTGTTIEHVSDVVDPF